MFALIVACIAFGFVLGTSVGIALYFAAMRDYRDHVSFEYNLKFIKGEKK
jgi:hypothetical protein